MKSPPMPGGLPSAAFFRAVLVALAVAVGGALFLLWWEVPSGEAVPAARRPPPVQEPLLAEEEAPAIVATPAPTPTPPVGRYAVKEGDTLLAIALRFGTTVRALAEANGLKEPYPLRIGQELVIPGAGEVAATPTPTAAASPTPSATPSTAPGRYTVKEGDTLLAIAIRFGTTVEALAKVNNLNEPYPLQVGQELVIP